MKGLLHQQRSELDEAIAAYRAAADQGPRLAKIYHEAGLLEKAAAELAISAVLSRGDLELRRLIEEAQAGMRGR